MTILIFAAHPDDIAIGLGGTVAKYARQGKHIVSVIFSYGEGADPIKDSTTLIKQHTAEAKKASKILGIKETIFLGLSDLAFERDSKEPSTEKKITDIFERYKPELTFIHKNDDMHSAHKVVAEKINIISSKINFKTTFYAYYIFPPIKPGRRNQPKLYIDISDTFQLKKSAMSLFKTQKLFFSFYQIPTTLLQNWLSGFKARCKYAEIFYKI
ncbi:MAG: PIG-L family deacetylase [DPANN group archaeon]|nr:PIG-L family deacetylase [DPANN group archaeon]